MRIRMLLEIEEGASARADAGPMYTRFESGVPHGFTSRPECFNGPVCDAELAITQAVKRAAVEHGVMVFMWGVESFEARKGAGDE